MIRLLVMSHAAVLRVNRHLFQHLARIANVQITLVAPQRWQGDLIRNLEFQEGQAEEKMKIIPLPVFLSGNGSLFFYRSTLKTLLMPESPNILFLDEEPWSLAAFQAC